MKISNEAVEATARKVAGEDRGYDFYEYPYNSNDRERYRAEARTALEAALPHLIDEDELAAVIEVKIREMRSDWARKYGSVTESPWADGVELAYEISKHLRGES